ISLANIMKNYPGLNIEISGHTDNEGEDTFNLKLSEDRAKNVVTFMIANGINKDRLSYKGFGETRPLVTNDTSANRMKNRRIEFKVLSK
ncbi:MAG: OmpA family protein, partial [Bacteroidota bacterium]|nr:OmpA family protein [Bacteroidota bacterium]